MAPKLSKTEAAPPASTDFVAPPSAAGDPNPAPAVDADVSGIAETLAAHGDAPPLPPVQPHHNLAYHPSGPVPIYKCHKEVHALKIASIEAWDENDCIITPADPAIAPFACPKAWADRYSPAPGGYVVVYDDGYTSFSPALAFESGYTLLTLEQTDSAEFARRQALEVPVDTGGLEGS